MKNYVSLFFACLIGVAVTAQKVIEKNIDHNGRSIELDVKFAHEINVKTWDKSTIYFKADIMMKNEDYLDLYKLDIDEGSSYISITSDTADVFEAFREEWDKSPKKKRYYYTWDSYEFNYTLYVPKNTEFKITSINGSMKSEIIEGDFTADLINGNIDIEKYSGRLDLKTINGEIDLRIGNASLVAETIHGDIYADEKLALTSHDRHVGQKVERKQTGTKNRLLLNTINGNMYLRL